MGIRSNLPLAPFGVTDLSSLEKCWYNERLYLSSHCVIAIIPMGKVLIAGGSLYYTDKNPESRLHSGYEGPQEVTWQTSYSKLGHCYILTELSRAFFTWALGWVCLAKGQTPTQALSHYPSSRGQGEKIRSKNSWVKMRTERSLTTYCHGQNRLNLRKINLLLIKIDLVGTKRKQNAKHLPQHLFLSTTSPNIPPSS